MTVQIEVSRQQYGVGQGGFHVQSMKFDVAGVDSFSYRFVYDCGSSSGHKELKWCISHAIADFDGAINAVYVSHFEYDHVNGLADLAQKAAVQRLYVPHITPPSALHIIAKLCADGQPITAAVESYLADLLSVARGDDDLHGIPLTRVSPGRDGTPRLDGDADGLRSEENLRIVSDEVGGSSVNDYRGVRIRLEGKSGPRVGGLVLWEIVNWCHEFSAALTSEIHSRAVLIGGYASDCDPGLQKGAKASEVSKALRWIKANFKELASAFTDAIDAHNLTRKAEAKPPIPKNHNVVSLCVYSGPGFVQSEFDLYMCGPGPRFPPLFGMSSDLGRDAWLATGDAMLKLPEVWDAFHAHFRAERLGRCQTVVIPHHGAGSKESHNFNPALLHPLQNGVISAGATNLYGHPHPGVVREILGRPAFLRLVTERDPLGFVEYFRLRSR